jgi:ribose transport system ATP-binding protein
VSFEVRRGEILGLAGLIGSGRTETLRAAYGADLPERGEVWGAGPRGGALGIRSPADAVRAGIGMIPEDRKEHGLLLPRSVRVNTTLARLGSFVRRWGWIDAEAEWIATRALCDRLDVQCRSMEQPTSELSGGNQQKVVIARWLLRDCDVLLFDEPTRGVDVASKWGIYRLLDELARAGKAIVMVSSELEELLALCDRIAVLSAGRLVATFQRGDWDAERIMAAAFSEHLKAGSVGKGSS